MTKADIIRRHFQQLGSKGGKVRSEAKAAAARRNAAKALEAKRKARGGGELPT
jgi:hypothetical protein